MVSTMQNAIHGALKHKRDCYGLSAKEPDCFLKNGLRFYFWVLLYPLDWYKQVLGTIDGVLTIYLD